MVIRSPVSCVAPATPQALPQDDTHAHTRCLAHIRTQYSCREHGRGDRGRSYPVLLRDVSCCAARRRAYHTTHPRDIAPSRARHLFVYSLARRGLPRLEAGLGAYPLEALAHRRELLVAVPMLHARRETAAGALAVDAHLARAVLEHLGKDGRHLAPLFHPGLRHRARVAGGEQ